MSYIDRLAVLTIALAAPLPAAAFIACTGLGASLNAGEYEANSATPVDASVVFSVSCVRHGGPSKATVTVALGPSANSGGIARRSMRRSGGDDVLGYNLYLDPARLRVWGDTPGSNTVSNAIALPNDSAGVVTFTIYSRIDALQDVRPGAYSDSLSVNVDF